MVVSRKRSARSPVGKRARIGGDNGIPKRHRKESGRTDRAEHRAGAYHGARSVALRDSAFLHCRETARGLLRAGAALLLARPAIVCVLDADLLPLADRPQGTARGSARTWREREGGMLHTVTKAAVYMFAGLFGSLFFEITYLVVFNFRPGNPYRDMMWFAILPFMTFGPVILLWLSRWTRGRKQGDFIVRAKNDPDLQDQVAGGFSLREEPAQQKRALLAKGGMMDNPSFSNVVYAHVPFLRQQREHQEPERGCDLQSARSRAA